MMDRNAVTEAGAAEVQQLAGSGPGGIMAAIYRTMADDIGRLAEARLRTVRDAGRSLRALQRPRSRDPVDLAHNAALRAAEAAIFQLIGEKPPASYAAEAEVPF